MPNIKQISFKSKGVSKIIDGPSSIEQLALRLTTVSNLNKSQGGHALTCSLITTDGDIIEISEKDGGLSINTKH